MSNTLSANPVVVTTAFTGYKKNGGMPTSGPIFIDEIFWLSPANVSDTFTLTDNAGNTIRTGVCEVALQSQVFQEYGKMVGDFSVSQISSGTLYISYH
jgi:hypothetical protein